MRRVSHSSSNNNQAHIHPKTSQESEAEVEEEEEEGRRRVAKEAQQTFLFKRQDDKKCWAKEKTNESRTQARRKRNTA